MQIIHKHNKNIDLTAHHNDFSNIIIKIIKTLFINHSLKEDIIAEKYKPSRIQYIIDNYGIDALDNY